MSGLKDAPMAASKSNVLSANSSGALSDAQLEGVVGGVGASFSVSDDDDKYEGDADAVADAAPGFENTGKTNVDAWTEVGDDSVSAHAVATAGHTDTVDLGLGVTLTSKYTVSAAAHAFAGADGVGAGATAGAGASVEFDVGRGVTVGAAATGVAQAGGMAGIQNNSLVAEGGVAATATASVSQNYQSGDLGGGIQVEQGAEIEAGAQAAATGRGMIGAGGVSAEYGANAGFYVKAEGEVEVGGESGSVGVSGGVISPGSVSAGLSGGVTVEDGALKISLGSEFAFVFGGVSLDIEIELQLFDRMAMVGTTDEINKAIQEAADHTAKFDELMTSEWRGNLRQDVRDAEREVRHAAEGVDAAEGAVRQYDDNVKSRVEHFLSAQADIAERREHAAGLADPVKREEMLGLCDKETTSLAKEVEEWKALMDAPEAAAERELLLADLNAAKAKLGIVQEFAEAAQARLEFASGMTYVQACVAVERAREQAENRISDALATLSTAEQEHAHALKDIYHSRDEQLEQLQSKLDDHRAGLADKAAIGADVSEARDKVEAVEADMRRVEEEFKVKINNYIEKAADTLGSAGLAMRAAEDARARFNTSIAHIHPLDSAHEAKGYTQSLLEAQRKQYDELSPTATEAELRVMRANFEGATIIEELAGDNLARLIEGKNIHAEEQAKLLAEADRLRTWVRHEGFFDALARAFS